MGKNKLLLPYNGKYLFESTLSSALTFSDRIIAVLGYEEEQIRKALTSYRDVEIRVNSDYEKGQKSSTLVGLEGVWDDVAMPATSSVVTNRTSLTWYGPQLTVDTYPAVSVFYNVGLAFGDALNSDSDERYWEFAAVYGIQAEIMILDIAKFYWQWGFVTNPVFNEECRAISRIGFTFGV